jgi:chaperone modulatory protein CbpM
MTYDEDALTNQLGVITLARLRTFVAVGCVRPTAIGGREHFTEADLARIELLCLLQDEFHISADGLPVVMHLIDQIHGLRGALRAISSAIDAQPPGVRDDIARTLRALAG